MPVSIKLPLLSVLLPRSTFGPRQQYVPDLYRYSICTNILDEDFILPSSFFYEFSEEIFTSISGKIIFFLDTILTYVSMTPIYALIFACII
jgi:hypothetical protein